MFYFIDLFKVGKNESILLDREIIRITVNHLLIVLAKCFCLFDMCEKISKKLLGKKNCALINGDINLMVITKAIFEKALREKEYKPWNKEMSNTIQTKCVLHHIFGKHIV